MLTPCRSNVTFVLALDPLQKQGLGHLLFSDSLQKQSHNLHLFSRLPAEAKSPLCEFVDMLIICKCKITFVLALDPLQKQDLGLHLFFSTPCRSKVTIIWICWYADPLQMQDHVCFGTRSPLEARSWPFFTFRLPTEAKSQPSFTFHFLQKQSHHYLNSLICWSSANARSRLFWH